MKILSPQETIDMLGTKEDFNKSKKIEGVKCPNCGVVKYSEEDIENIDEFGECLICESLRTDLAESLEEDNQ